MEHIVLCLIPKYPQLAEAVETAQRIAQLEILELMVLLVALAAVAAELVIWARAATDQQEHLFLAAPAAAAHLQLEQVLRGLQMVAEEVTLAQQVTGAELAQVILTALQTAQSVKYKMALEEY
jgi:hypothetical protein